MAAPTERVILQKQEFAATGGDANDTSDMLWSPLRPYEDVANVAGIAYQQPDGAPPGDSNDGDVMTWRESDELWLKDGDVPGGVKLGTFVIGPATSTNNALVRYDGATGKLLQNSGVIVDDANEVTGVTHLHIDHTAVAPDEHALEIDVDAGGFGDVKAIDIVYVTGTLGNGEEAEVILVLIDESASTGGHVAGVEVATTALGSATIDGLGIAIGVNPVHQLSGTFGDLDSILVLAVNRLTELSGGGAGAITVFVADNDTVTVGDDAKFQELEFDIATGASGPGVSPTFEYSTGVETWATFTPIDGTNGFKNTGVVIWSLDDIPSWAVGTGSEFLIRITRTQNTLTTTPILDLIQRATGVEYIWDKDGLLRIGGIEANGEVRHTPIINNAATGTVNLDFTTGNRFRLGLTGNITSLTANLPNNGWSGSLHLVADQAGRSIVWTVAVKWVNDVEPPVSALIADQRFICHFERESGDLFGSFSGPYPA